jgi:hypothetical protein
MSCNLTNGKWNFGWGVNAGLGIGNSKGSIGINGGYGSGGWTYGIGGSYYTDYERAYMRAEARNRSNVDKAFSYEKYYSVAGMQQDATWGKMYVISNVESNASLTDGHAWIRLESQSGDATTMSLWGNRGEQEFWTNLEVNAGYGEVYKSQNISILQYDKIGEFNSNPSNVNWTVFNTCAGYSSSCWNYVTGDNLSALDIFFFTTPRSLSRSIQNNP